MAPRTDFPPVRACIFDMDGLLINSEDAYTDVTNTILHENGRPDLPWSIKAQLQGRPGPAAGKIFREWAKLPISEEAFLERQRELQREAFKHCKPLPGVEVLLRRLSSAHTVMDAKSRARSPGGDHKRIRLALATSSHGKNYEIKTQGMKKMFSVFPERNRIVGDDPRIPRGRGKPLPDIYLLALETINAEVTGGEDPERPITPEECLVFEDSVPGIEAGRRAGMRVIWVPHPGLLEVYKDRVADVLAGRTGEHDETDLSHQESKPLNGSPGMPGELDDGWAEILSSLEDFNYVKYGIDWMDQRYRSEGGQLAQPGTTDKELEEMTAMADGKTHAAEEGSSRVQTPVPVFETPDPVTAKV
ncbi:hypothetical protein H2198_008513 [Neophaeococcomyces mojaviensis]|uniref:Uncharacterized protein n=1 Tax=Neophaeococcomyces mojaviensis TaxID=3383035 RepID=A0ACC2ZX70_9EURO|nr:hypothetical protein H2198_008513 [Knufia sp. JES_112]